MLPSTMSQQMQTRFIRKQTYINPKYTDKIEHSIRQSMQLGRHLFAQQPVHSAPLIDLLISPNQDRLHKALLLCKKELLQVTSRSDMVIAIADTGGTIQWTNASRLMRSAAEKVNFVAGGQWGEEHVGINALALSLKLEQPSCVISDEHLMASIYDWVCYAAPIVDPYTKKTIGVLDLSTKIKRHNHFGVIAAQHCATLIQNALVENAKNTLYIRALGSPTVFFDGKPIHLTPRQIEILCILCLSPKGLSLELLHQALYGERKITQATLKSEISHLRHILNGVIGSRPYRLLASVDADFLELERTLDAGYLDAALRLSCHGLLLNSTESPFLINWRTYIESRLSFLITQTNQIDVLLKYLSYAPDAVDAFERLLDVLPSSHPLRNHITPTD